MIRLSAAAALALLVVAAPAVADTRLVEMRSHDYLASAHRRYETHRPAP